MSIIIFKILGYILLISIGIALYYRYRITGDKGFIWLMLPLFIGPFIWFFSTYWFEFCMKRFLAGEETFFPIC